MALALGTEPVAPGNGAQTRELKKGLEALNPKPKAKGKAKGKAAAKKKSKAKAKAKALAKAGRRRATPSIAPGTDDEDE